MSRKTKTVIFFILASFLALTVAQDEDIKIGPQPEGQNTTTTTTTTTTPTTATTPTTTTTTTTTSTTTATPATTSTTSTTTTTPTTTPTTTSTPSVPTTTTSAPPTPTPSTGRWIVRNETSNITCIVAEMTIQLNVSYQKSGENKTSYATVDVPSNATASGNCGNLTQMLVISWLPAGITNQSNVITLTFNKNDTSKLYSLGHIDVVVQANPSQFPGIANLTTMTLVNNQEEFTTSVGMSYLCSKIQSFNLLDKNDINSSLAVLNFSHLRVESFHGKSDDKFNSAKYCDSSSSTDIVPIAVGCALVGLVAIVLIAYLVGRRRSQARGYLSM